MWRPALLAGRKQQSKKSFALKEEVRHVHDSSGASDFAFARCVAHMAIQPVMGILPEWRAGIGRRNCDRPPLVRSFVISSFNALAGIRGGSPQDPTPILQ